jgi:hypothetical protein
VVRCTYEVFTAREAGRQLEFMRHVRRAHDFARPLAAHVIQLIDLDPPSSHARRGRRVLDWQHEVRDRARVPGLVPLHLDGVAGRGVERLDGLAVGGWHVARHVVAGEVCDGGVGRGHADADVGAGRGVVDEDGVEVLVGGGGCHDGGGKEDGFGQHGEVVWLVGWLVGGGVGRGGSDRGSR